MRRERLGVKDAGDGAGLKIDCRDGAPDDAGARSAAEGDDDDLAGAEFLIRMVGQNTGALPEDAGGDDLVEHSLILHDIIDL